MPYCIEFDVRFYTYIPAAESINIIILLIDVNLANLLHANELFKENQRR